MILSAKKYVAALLVFICVCMIFQQSVMNFGILLVQNLVNSFGATVMAAFTVAVACWLIQPR